MKKASIGFWEKIQLQETIAREIYSEFGYNTFGENFDEDYMQKSKHPTEQACYRAAGRILDKLTKSN